MMSEARFRAMYSGASSIARKTYDATPIQEAWTASQITGEMNRNGANCNLRIVQGCMNSLITAGLVTEVSRGYFVRTPIRKNKVPSPEMKTLPAPKPQPLPQPTLHAPTMTVLDKLTQLMARAEKLAQDTKELTDSIVAIGVEIEEEMAKDKAALTKMRQLQVLLKELG